VEPQRAAVAEAKECHVASIAATAQAKSKLKEAQDAAKAGETATAAAEEKRVLLEQALKTKARLENPEPTPAPEVTPAGDAVEPRSPATAKSPVRTPTKQSPAKLKSEAASLAKQLIGVIDDDSLLDAMKISLAKAPDERGEFDHRVLEQLQAALRTGLEAQTKAVADLADGKAGRAAAVETAAATKDAALEAGADAEMAFSNAEVSLVDVEAAQKAAIRESAALDTEVAAAKAEVAWAEAKAAEFRKGALATFEAARNPPAPEPAPEAEEAAVDATAEAC